MSKHIIVAAASGGQSFSVRVRDHVVPLDQPLHAGGADRAPTPLEMLSVALAGCVALYARKYCARHALDGDDIAVEVKPIWREDPGRVARFDVTLRIPDAIPAEHRDALLRAAADCPVHHTLSMTPEITLRLQAASAVGA